MKKMTDYRSRCSDIGLYDLQSHKKRCSQRLLVCYRPLANSQRRAAGENQRSFSLQEHSRTVSKLLWTARTFHSEPRRSKHPQSSAQHLRARCSQPA